LKGKSMDRVGNPMNGDLYPGWDLYGVAANGLSGTFRPTALTRHSIYESIERLNPTDPTAQSLFYLMKEDPATKAQFTNEFPTNPSTAAGSADFSKYAYDYCYDLATKLSTYSTAALSAKLTAISQGKCSRYAVLTSRHLNEANRMVASTDVETPRNIRSRMVFRFMGETGGYFNSESPTRKATEYGQDELDPSIMQATVNGWNHALYGSRKIEPILENNKNTGRLQGFKITNPDGTQYFFNQPVRSIISADYTTNQAKGAPLFIDKSSTRSGDNFLNLIGNAFLDFVNLGPQLVNDPVATLGKLAGWYKNAYLFVDNSVASFFWSSPVFKDKCQTLPDEQYNYSYSMKVNPYATQWLLTEVRGPEFVLLSNTDMTKNIGYHVKFNYEVPSMYKWRFPFAPPRTPKDKLPNFRLAKNGATPENCHSDLYHGSFGVKEVVYLKSIETSSHRADFFLNDPLKDPRRDGKGWIQDWTGRSEAGKTTPVSTGMPILVNVQMEAAIATIPNQKWTKKCKDDFDATNQARGATCWWEKNLKFSVDGAYLNTQPTSLQISRILGKGVVISGMENASTKTQAGLGVTVYANGLVLKKFNLNEILVYNTTPFPKPTVSSIVPVTGQGLALGSTKIKFATTLDFPIEPYNEVDLTPATYANVIRTGMRSNPLGAAVCLTTLTPNDTLPTTISIPASVKLGGAQVAGVSLGEMQPLILYNDFVETSGPTDNQMRRLDSIRIVEKANA
ncbi:MAG: hypothetical protein M3Y08_21085, partial [Fibrobacterota bacterium]|nr:hypothetical protein [Fibrobacterota bacterium]